MKFEEVRKLNIDEACRILSYEIYKAAKIVENLENAEKIHGNAHHFRQKLAASACQQLRERWIA